MNAASKTRSERRMEKKQALLLLILVLVVSLASFTLGVIVGQRGAERDLSMKQQAAEQVLVAKLPPRTEPQAAPQPATTVAEKPQDAAPTEETKLTFYDNLAKPANAPLGSGINLDPQEKAPVAKPPIPLPDTPIVVQEATRTATSVADSQPTGGQPKVTAQGSYSLQVGSFAAAADAGKLKKALLDKGYPAFTSEANLGKKGIWYRVRLGPYADNDAARAMQLLVDKQDKIKGFITRQ